MKNLRFASFTLVLLASCGGSATSPTGSTSSSGPSGGSAGAGGGAAGGGVAGSHSGGSASGAAGTGAAATGGSPSGGSPAAGQGGIASGGAGAPAGGSSGAAGDGGSSGASAGGTAGVGGAGTGGASIVCSKLGAAEILTLDGDPQWEQRRARLAPLANDRAAVVVGLDAAESPGPVPSPLAHVEFAPWGAWPVSLPAPTIVSTNGGGEVRVARGMSAGFGLLYRNDAFLPPMPPAGLVITPDVPEGATMVDGALLESTQPGPPLWLARGATGEDLDQQFLAGWSWELPLDSLHFAVRWSWTSGAGTPTVVDGLACGTSTLSADAVASGQGYLVAATTSAPFGMCGKGGNPGPDGEPNRLQIARVDHGVATFGDEHAGFGPIFAVAMAPRTDGGAWVVWLPFGDPAAAPPRASAVDATGKLVGPEFDVGAPGESGDYAVGSIGDRLVVAQLQTIDPSAPTIGVFLYDDAGTSSGATIVPPGGHFAAPELSVLGSPSGDAVLVSWSDQATSTGATYQAHVARLKCGS